MVDYTQFSRYRVTQDGEVFGVDGKLMRTFRDKDGYLTVGLRDDSKKKHLVKVHRLVATRYIPTNDYSMTVNHKDGNKENNNVNNLEWLSNADNLKHSWRTLGRKHFVKAVVNGRGEVFESVKAAALANGVTIAAISNCVNGRRKTAKGTEWRFFNG